MHQAFDSVDSRILFAVRWHDLRALDLCIEKQKAMGFLLAGLRYARSLVSLSIDLDMDARFSELEGSGDADLSCLLDGMRAAVGTLTELELNLFLEFNSIHLAKFADFLSNAPQLRKLYLVGA